jgi:cytochrome d ubiquinol oxidase subunit II
MSPPTRPEAIIFIMVGLAGDLSRRKLVPALDNLFVENRLPEHFAILGVGQLHRRLLTALAHGFVLGGVVTGLRMAGDTYVGGVWDWLNPFTLFVSVGLVFGYLLLGATYLIIKTEHAMQNYARTLASVTTFLTFCSALGVMIWSWQIHPLLVQKWLVWPSFLITAVPALLAFLTFFWLLKTLRAGKSETAPFILTTLIFALFLVSLAGSLHPYILPPSMTLQAAAAQPLTLKVMLMVIVPLLPVMLIYNAYQYRVFRGKAEAGYGEQ